MRGVTANGSPRHLRITFSRFFLRVLRVSAVRFFLVAAGLLRVHVCLIFRPLPAARRATPSEASSSPREAAAGKIAAREPAAPRMA